MLATCACSWVTGPSSASMRLLSWARFTLMLALVLGLVCLSSAWYAWNMSAFTFSSLSLNLKSEE